MKKGIKKFIAAVIIVAILVATILPCVLQWNDSFFNKTYKQALYTNDVDDYLYSSTQFKNYYEKVAENDKE